MATAIAGNIGQGGAEARRRKRVPRVDSECALSVYFTVGADFELCAVGSNACWVVGRLRELIASVAVHELGPWCRYDSTR